MPFKEDLFVIIQLKDMHGNSNSRKARELLLTNDNKSQLKLKNDVNSEGNEVPFDEKAA